MKKKPTSQVNDNVNAFECQSSCSTCKIAMAKFAAAVDFAYGGNSQAVPGPWNVLKLCGFGTLSLPPRAAKPVNTITTRTSNLNAPKTLLIHIPSLGVSA